jgi:hypothetical protein
VEIIIAMVGAVLVAVLVIDIRARRRGRRVRMMGDHNDVYRTMPHAAPDLGAGTGGVDGGGGAG